MCPKRKSKFNCWTIVKVIFCKRIYQNVMKYRRRNVHKIILLSSFALFKILALRFPNRSAVNARKDGLRFFAPFIIVSQQCLLARPWLHFDVTSADDCWCYLVSATPWPSCSHRSHVPAFGQIFNYIPDLLLVLMYLRRMTVEKGTV